jgi:Zn-dependent peptidase ImmA (M78 family)/transcriptional regulator with XRE-family HTH domain
MTSSYDPDYFSRERLRIARLKAGLTLRDLAERVNVSHALISQYESGRSKPSSTILAQLSLACGVPPAFLTHSARPVSLGGLDGTHFRSLRSTTKQQRGGAWVWSEIVLDVVTALEKFVRLPAPNLPTWSLSADATREEIRFAAEHLRDAWNLPQGPVGHLVRHMEANGVIVCRLPVADSGIDAFSHQGGDRPVVILGADKGDAARSRFDAAHELGHLVCHPEADPGGRQENQAHAFAAELLMPETDMRAALPRRFSLNAYAGLKQEWGVSIAALLYRAKTLEIISEAAYRRAVVDFNSKYGRRNEPFPLTRFDDPSLIANAATVAGQSGVDLERIANEAHLGLDDVEAVVAGGMLRPLVTPS